MSAALKSAPSDVILQADGVGRSFGKFVALKNVSAQFRRGALTSIIGPNGAGKSTFFNLLSGAFPPSTGRITFEGRDVTGLAQHRFAPLGIAKSFQITNVFPQLTTLENVRVARQALVSRFDLWRPRDQWGSGTGATSPPPFLPMASSVRSRSAWRSQAIHACFCSMSRQPA
jgi:branched-chain amino acid transport system ATP-binding protein